MVLEERISVESEAAAIEVVRYLKKEGIIAHILSEPRMTVALILAGRYEDLQSFLLTCQEKYENCEPGGGESDECPVDFDPLVWKNSLKILDTERVAMCTIFTEHQSGDIIGSHVYQAGKTELNISAKR
jgi:hypothetical protein